MRKTAVCIAVFSHPPSQRHPLGGSSQTCIEFPGEGRSGQDWGCITSQTASGPVWNLAQVHMHWCIWHAFQQLCQAGSGLRILCIFHSNSHAKCQMERSKLHSTLGILWALVRSHRGLKGKSCIAEKVYDKTIVWIMKKCVPLQRHHKESPKSQWKRG